MTEQQMKTRITGLTIYVVISTLLFTGLFIFSFKKNSGANADEFTAKRFNLIGEDGSLRMIISNETRQHPGIINGKVLPKRERPAGILFFDNKGNECGGLVYNESTQNDKVNKMMSFTMDNYKNDQVVQLINDESYKGDKAGIRRGLVINEYPVGADMSVLIDTVEHIQKIKDTAVQHKAMQALLEKEGSKRRLFMGRTGENQSGVFLYDSKGKPRLELYVDSLDVPKIVSLDALGNVKHSLPLE